jgi:hypothetical protein
MLLVAGVGFEGARGGRVGGLLDVLTLSEPRSKIDIPVDISNLR